MKKALLALMVLLAPTAAFAQRYPAKDITITVVFGAGGGTDVLCRLVAGEIREYLGRNVVVTNVTGGVNASNGMYAVDGLPHDGYNLVGFSESVVAGPVMGGFNKKMDAWYPFLVAGSPDVISVPASSPYKSLKDLVAATKAAPGQVKGGAGNIGGIHHLNIAAFEKGTGTKFNYIPYAGSAPTQNAAVTKEIDVVVTSIAEQAQLIKGGQLRPLAMLTDEAFMLDGYGEIPSALKLYPDLKKYLPLMQAIGYGVAADVPKDVTQKLDDAFKKLMKDKEVLAFLAANNYQIIGKSGPEASAIFTNLESVFSWTLFELGQAKTDPSSVGIKKP